MSNALVGEVGPVGRFLTATDVFIASLVQLGAELDEARSAIDLFERDMREFRAALLETFRDSEVSDG